MLPQPQLTPQLPQSVEVKFLMVTTNRFWHKNNNFTVKKLTPLPYPSNFGYLKVTPLPQLLPQHHPTDLDQLSVEVNHWESSGSLANLFSFQVTHKPVELLMELDQPLPQPVETPTLDASRFILGAASNSHSLSSNIISVRFISGHFDNETAPKTNLVFLHLLLFVPFSLFVCCSPHTTQLSVHFDDVGLMKKKYKEF